MSPNRLLRTVVPAAIALLALFCQAVLAGEAALPQQIKAAFIYRFTFYVTWPEKSFANQSSPFVIWAPEKNEIYTHLLETVAGKTAQGRHIEVKRYIWPQDLKGAAHIIYVGKTQVKDMDKLVHAAEAFTPGVFIVSESSGAEWSGASLNFITEKDRVRFQINMDPAKKSGLSISSKLLRLATTVTGMEVEK
ncbi:MAG: YfiR family protein [Nitrospinae bacterium]|nr:YfiR family protein [Nitrospinota bacterium]